MLANRLDDLTPLDALGGTRRIIWHCGTAPFQWMGIEKFRILDHIKEMPRLGPDAQEPQHTRRGVKSMILDHPAESTTNVHEQHCTCSQYANRLFLVQILPKEPPKKG
jgi:hypothetical protein